MSDNQLKDFYMQVVSFTRQDIVKQKMLLPPEQMAELCQAYNRPRRSLKDALALQSELKFVVTLQKNFPQEGVTTADFNALELAKSFSALPGAAALAVVTEKHFYDGAASMLSGITRLVNIPVIRWDFIIDEYQLEQSLLWGADAVRLLAGVLDQFEMEKLCRKAGQLDLQVVMQVSDCGELERVLSLESAPAVIAVSGNTLSANEIRQMRALVPENIPLLAAVDHLEKQEVAELKKINLLFERSWNYPPARLQKRLNELNNSN